MISSPQKQLPKQHTQQTTNIRAITGIRTRGPKHPTAADLRLRPHGDRDEQCYGNKNKIHAYSDTEVIVHLPPLAFVAAYMH